MIAAWLRDHTETNHDTQPATTPDHHSDTPTTRPRPKPFKPRLFHTRTSLTGNHATMGKIGDA
jgi:hypothetical protein